MAVFRSAPTGRRDLYWLLPRAALRLPWAILASPLRGEYLLDSFIGPIVWTGIPLRGEYLLGLFMETSVWTVSPLDHTSPNSLSRKA